MSIWTDLLFLHGHIATPAALALVTRTGACTAAPGPAAHRPGPQPACDDDGAASGPAHHPLRVAGQLR
jgi:hypothetical protein